MRRVCGNSLWRSTQWAHFPSSRGVTSSSITVHNVSANARCFANRTAPAGREVAGQSQTRRRPRKAATSKARGLSPEITSLYDAIMRDGALSKRLEVAESAALSPPPDEVLNFAKRMEELAVDRNSKACTELLSEMDAAGVAPTPSICLQALHACVRDVGAAIHVTDECMRWLHACPSSTEKEIVVETSRSLCGLFFKHRKQPWDVLRVVGWKEVETEEDVSRLVFDMNLGRHSVAWSVVGWALNKVGRPDETIRVLNVASDLMGLSMTNSVAHVMIEALGALGRIADADALFSVLQGQGVEPDERLVGSLLALISSESLLPNGCRRPTPNVDRVRELCNLIPDQSPRFIATCMRALACANLVEEADSKFAALEASSKRLLPDERACMTMMRLYSKLLVSGTSEGMWLADSDKWHEDLLHRADILWGKYFDVYGHLPPSPDESHARITLFPRYVLAKSIGGEEHAAVELLREAQKEDSLRARPWFKPEILHFQALLFGIGRSFNVEALDDTLNLMAAADIDLDESTLADAMLAFVGSGDCLRAAKLLVIHADGILAQKQLADASFLRYRKRLLKRIDLVIDAIEARLAAVCPSDSDDGHALLRHTRSIAANFKRDTQRRNVDGESGIGISV